MNIKVERAKFVEALGQVKKVVPAKPAIAALANVQIEVASSDALSLVGTDLSTSVKVGCPCKEADAGRFLVSCEKLLSIVSALVNDEITISTIEAERRILVTDGKSKFKMNVITDQPLPSNFGEDAKFCTVDVSELRDAIGQTLYAAESVSSNTPGTYPGLFFEIGGPDVVRCAATDRKKLAVCSMAATDVYDESDSKDMMTFYLPAHSAAIVKGFCKTGQCVITRFRHTISFKFDGVEYNSSLLSNAFPNYMPIVQASTYDGNKLEITAKDFGGIIKRATILAGIGTGKQRVASIALRTNAMVVSSSDAEYGASEEEMLCAYNGDDLTVCVDPDGFCEILSSFVGQDVVVSFKTDVTPINITCGKAVVIFMPMREASA